VSASEPSSWFTQYSDLWLVENSGVPRNFFRGGGGSTNSVENGEQRERGSRSGSPLVRGSAQFAIRVDFVKLSGCRGLLRMYFPRNCEFGPALSKLRNFGGGGVGGLNTPTSSRYAIGNEIHPVIGQLGTPTVYVRLCSAMHCAERCSACLFVISPYSLRPATVKVWITKNWWYSAVHCFWSAEELAELADGPTVCGEVTRGGCSFARNCTYGGGGEFTYAPHNDGPHIRRWSHKLMIL
jgi:hypothetical protein